MEYFEKQYISGSVDTYYTFNFGNVFLQSACCITIYNDGTNMVAFPKKNYLLFIKSNRKY